MNKLQCPECLQEEGKLSLEIYQECIYPPNKPPRCIAVTVPAGSCMACGYRWWTDEAIEAVEKAFFDSL